MKKNLFLLFLLTVLPLSAYEFKFPGNMPWTKWQPGKRVNLTADQTMLKMRNLAADSYIIIRNLNLDAARITNIEIEYKLTGLTAPAPGQLYFLNDKISVFSDAAKFNFGDLKSDGQWHQLTLTLKDLPDADLWRNGGRVTALRLDMTDSAAQTLDIRSIKLNDSAPVPVQTVDASIYPAAAEPLPKHAPYVLAKAQFSQGIMAAQEDPPGAKTGNMPRRFLLRRTFDAAADLYNAYIQYTADDSSALYINGQKVDERRMYNAWKTTSLLDVKKYLRPGQKNVIVFDYSNFGNSGGVIMEMILRSRSGKKTFIRSGSDFRSAVFSEKLLQMCHSVSFDDSQWQGIRDYGVPPTAPWSKAIPYVNFNNFYQVTGQSRLPQAVYNAGEKIAFSLKFSGKAPSPPFPAAIKLFDTAGKQIYEAGVDLAPMIRQQSNNWILNFHWQLPAYLASRRISILIEPLNGFFGGVKPVVFAYKARVPADNDSNLTQIKSDGKVQLIMDGQAVYPLFGNMHHAVHMQPFDVSGFSKMPISLHSSATTDMNYPWWQAPDKYDFDYVDWFACRTLEENPGSKLVMWLTLRCPNWWPQYFGDEGMVWNDGTIDRTRFSFASEKALQAYIKTVVKYINHVENSPYRDRVAGYAINGGETVEWLGWQFNRTNNLKKLMDYSPLNQKKFAEFAAEHYPALGSNAIIPAYADRFGSDRDSLLLTPEKDLSVIAYNDYHSWVIADFLLRLGSTARNALKGKEKLLGCYYGYTYELPGMPGGSQLAGHRHLQMLMESGIFQFIMSPPSYQVRNAGEAMLDMKPFTSLGKHNILALIDDDTRTHLIPNANFNQTLDMLQTRSVMRRNTAVQLCRNLGVELLPLTYGNEFNAPEIIEDMTRVRAIGEHLQTLDVPRNAEIALVISEKSQSLLPLTPLMPANGEKVLRYNAKTGKPYITGAYPVKFSGEALAWPRKTISEVGAPADYILAEDLKNNPGDYKLYIMLNIWSFDADLLESIRQLQQKNTAILWMYAPGWVADGKSSVENMEKLLGRKFRMLPSPVAANIVMQDGSRIALPQAMLKPAFTVADPSQVKVLGLYADNDLPAAVEWQDNGAARQIFFGSYRLDREFVRKLAKELNIHLFNPDTVDFVEANSKLVMLHAATPGKKTIKFPQKSTVVDLFEGKIVAKDCNQYSWDAKVFDSKLYFYGSGEEARAMLDALNKNNALFPMRTSY